MLRSTRDFLDSLPLPKVPPKVPRDGTCPDCRATVCMCSGQSARDRRYAFHRKRRGLCKCGEPSRPNLTECQPCADKRIERARRLRADRSASGRCVRCPNRAEPDRRMCRWCARAVSRKRRNEYVSAGEPPGTGPGTRWTPAEDARIRQAAADNLKCGRVPGGRIAALAAELGRTPGAVRQRAMAIGARSRAG